MKIVPLLVTMAIVIFCCCGEGKRNVNSQSQTANPTQTIEGTNQIIKDSVVRPPLPKDTVYSVVATPLPPKPIPQDSIMGKDVSEHIPLPSEPIVGKDASEHIPLPHLPDSLKK